MGESTTLRELSGGTAYTQGAQLVYADNPFQRWTQGSSGDAYITMFRNGAIAVESQLKNGPQKINTVEGALYGIAGDISTVLSSGQEHIVSIDQSLIAAMGEKVVAYTDRDTVQHVERVMPGSAQDLALQRLFPATYRDATLDEGAAMAVRGWLHDHEDALIRDSMGDVDGLTDEEYKAKRYEAIQMLAQMLTGDILYTKVHYVRP